MWLHVEPTSRCNAWCPGCSRNKGGYGLSEFTLTDLDPQRLKDVMNEYSITQVQMCGTLGDPCASKTLDAQFDQMDNVQRLQIHTNGSLRKPKWWADLARRFSHLPQFDVWFALDGIGDVHEYYRQGTEYDRVIKNAQAFIDAGGNAVWQFIPFKHNEHQIKDCMRLSQQLGFKRFHFVKNPTIKSKNYHYQTGEPIELLPWSRDSNQEVKDRIKHKHNNTTVKRKNCMHLDMPSIYLGANGRVSACCYLRNIDLKEVDIEKDFKYNTFKQTCIERCG